MKKLLVAMVICTLCACTKAVTLQATDGSKADGTVELSYEYGSWDKPVVDLEQGHQAAKVRCASWGYGDAEAFGGSKSHCESPGTYGTCAETLVTMKYQCIDKIEPAIGSGSVKP